MSSLVSTSTLSRTVTIGLPRMKKNILSTRYSPFLSVVFILAGFKGLSIVKQCHEASGNVKTLKPGLLIILQHGLQGNRADVGELNGRAGYGIYTTGRGARAMEL